MSRGVRVMDLAAVVGMGDNASPFVNQVRKHHHIKWKLAAEHYDESQPLARHPDFVAVRLTDKFPINGVGRWYVAERVQGELLVSDQLYWGGRLFNTKHAALCWLGKLFAAKARP